MKSSRITGFHNLNISERQQIIFGQNSEILSSGGLTENMADTFIENAVGVFSLPIGIATNFIINGRELFIPMVTEEPSVIAAASNAARLCRSTGGFTCVCEHPITTCEILTTDSVSELSSFINTNRDILINEINSIDPLLVELGGGFKDIEIKGLYDSFNIILIHMDVRDAMGANTVNTAGEKIAGLLKLNGFSTFGTIITNAFPERTTVVKVLYNIQEINNLYPDWLNRFETMNRWAQIDPMRAVTHNKGIMNGVCAVLNSLGNDTRATESAAHLRSIKNGIYSPLSNWKKIGDEFIEGTLTIPVAGATVGGMTSHHPLVSYLKRELNLNTYIDVCSAAACCGLANNFAALLAISTDGIQKGHMKLHRKKTLKSL